VRVAGEFIVIHFHFRLGIDSSCVVLRSGFFLKEICISGNDFIIVFSYVCDLAIGLDYI
jgi:hypothetical protein